MDKFLAVVLLIMLIGGIIKFTWDKIQVKITKLK